MTYYRYVMVGDDGRSRLLEGDQLYDPNVDHNNVLPRLIADGWEPVRERRLGNAVLVLMTRCEFEIPSDDGSGAGDIPF